MHPLAGKSEDSFLARDRFAVKKALKPLQEREIDGSEFAYFGKGMLLFANWKITIAMTCGD